MTVWQDPGLAFRDLPLGLWPDLKQAPDVPYSLVSPLQMQQMLPNLQGVLRWWEPCAYPARSACWPGALTFSGLVPMVVQRRQTRFLVLPACEIPVYHRLSATGLDGG